MANKNKSLLIIGAVVLLLILALVGSYNGLASTRLSVDNELSNIDAVLQRRNDLIPNVIASVKSYAKHEAEVFQAVVDSRKEVIKSGTEAEKQEASNEISKGYQAFKISVEAYPQLKADTQFMALITELEGAENRIAVARKNYNDAVKIYNKKTITFPSVIFAKMFGFQQAEFFKASEGADKVPNAAELLK